LMFTLRYNSETFCGSPVSLTQGSRWPAYGQPFETIGR
jgi:hypothetical protein